MVWGGGRGMGRGIWQTSIIGWHTSNLYLPHSHSVITYHPHSPSPQCHYLPPSFSLPTVSLPTTLILPPHSVITYHPHSPPPPPPQCHYLPPSSPLLHVHKCHYLPATCSFILCMHAVLFDPPPPPPPPSVNSPRTLNY